MEKQKPGEAGAGGWGVAYTFIQYMHTDMGTNYLLRPQAAPPKLLRDQLFVKGTFTAADKWRKEHVLLTFATMTFHS